MAEDAKSGRGKHPRPLAYGISVLCLFRSAAFAGLRAHFRAGLAGSGRAALRAGFALCAGRAGGSGAFRLRRGRGGARAVAVRHQRGDLLPVHSGLIELNPFHRSGLPSGVALPDMTAAVHADMSVADSDKRSVTSSIVRIQMVKWCQKRRFSSGASLSYPRCL